MEKINNMSERYQQQLADLAGKLVTQERFGDNTPFYAAEWELAEPVEMGWQAVEGVGIPPRTDGTQPRAV